MEEKPKNRLVPVLVVLLIVASFLLGHLFTKVQYLEKSAALANTNTGQVAGTQNQPDPIPAAPVDVEFADATPLGNPQAKVAVVEFTDYQCPFCGRLFTDTFPAIKKEYIDTGKIRYYVRDFPLNAIHPQAQKGAEAVNCAKDQNKFWEYHDKVFTNQTAIAIDDLKKYAADIGLNTATFNSCLDNGKYKDKVTAETAAGEKIGVRGTPASFVGVISGNKINGTQISGAVSFSEFKTEIDKALAQVK